MGFRFSKRINILPGIGLNLSKSGVSLSLGPRGAKTTISTKGVRETLRIPGTGLSWSKTHSFGGKGKENGTATAKGGSTRRTATKRSESAQEQDYSIQSDREKLDLGFFSRLLLSAPEKQCVEGLKAYLRGDRLGALVNLKAAASVIPDAAFTAAFIELDEAPDEALRLLALAKQRPNDLGKFYVKYQLELTMTIAICDGVVTGLQPEPKAIALAEVEALQKQGKFAEASQILTDLLQQRPGDLLAIVSLADLVLDGAPEDKTWLETILRHTANIGNDSPLHTVALYFRAVALHNLDLPEPALETVNLALKSASGRSPDLLLDLRALKAGLLDELGKTAPARKEWEKIYAENPDYPGVA
ncbi:MAG: DUF4236 domain-containing protein, partial [Victivallales bacterium]|nr:DUF4236 domain-containing protein [Victivallales bacterium]